MPSESTILEAAEISAQMLRMIPRTGADWGRDPQPIGRWLVSCRIATHGDPVWTAHEAGGSDEPPTGRLTLTCDAPGPIAEIIARGPAPSTSGAEVAAAAIRWARAVCVDHGSAEIADALREYCAWAWDAPSAGARKPGGDRG